MRLNWESALLILLVLEILLFGAINPRMLDVNMLLFSTSDFICIGIVALPLTLVIISGGIDISLGSTIGLCAIALGVMMQAGWPMAVAIPLTLLLGLLCGLLNAALSVNGMPYALYGLVGVASAIAALVMVSYFGSARSDLGRDLLMPALTAAVLGGANIYGGSGSVVGTALAALLVGYLQQGLQMVGIPNQVSSALSGALLVVVVMGRSLSLHREWVRSLFRKLSGA